MFIFNRSKTLASLIASLCAIWPAQSWAGTIDINPVSLSISEERDTVTLRISNNADEPLVMRTDTRAWAQENGEDRYDLTRELIISPPIFTIAPHQTQVVRIGFRGNAWKPAAYRIIAEEVPMPRPGTVQVALRFDLPLLAGIAEANTAELDWSLRQLGDGRWQLEAFNGKTSAVRLSPSDVAAATGISEEISIRFGTILPNSRKRWILGDAPVIEDAAKFAALAKKNGNVRLTVLQN